MPRAIKVTERLRDALAARRFVGRIIAKTLQEDVYNNSMWLEEDMDYESRRRIKAAVAWWLKRLSDFVSDR